MKLLGSPTANIPTMFVAARVLAVRGPTEREELGRLLRPPLYFRAADEGESAPLRESLDAARTLGLFTESGSASADWQLGPALEASDRWLNAYPRFALSVLRMFCGQIGDNTSEVAELIPWFLHQGWQVQPAWSSDAFARQRIINSTQADAFFDRWAEGLGLAVRGTRRPDPTPAVLTVLEEIGHAQMTGAEFVRCLAEFLPTGPGHAAAAILAPEGGASRTSENVLFPSVGYAITRAQRAGRLRLEAPADAPDRERMLFSLSSAESGFRSVARVEVCGP